MVRRGSNYVERCPGGVEVYDSEVCQSCQLEHTKLGFTLIFETRTEGSSQGLSLERPLTSRKLSGLFPLAFVSYWLDITERCRALDLW